MKHKIFNPLAISLATSVLFLSIPKAFATNVPAQRVQNQPQTVIFDVASSSDQTQKLESSRANNPKAQTDQSSLGQSGSVSDPLGGLLVTVVFITYILLGLRYRKHRTHRAAILIQQIETLERIWNMQSHQ
jgi:uncharacterized protein YabN with tetrapyrrole methylase and pyrophosphatase domain